MKTTADPRLTGQTGSNLQAIRVVAMKIPNVTAETAYADRHMECAILVERIAEALGDMDAPSETTHWGHVGDLERIRSMLREVAEVLGVSP